MARARDDLETVLAAADVAAAVHRVADGVASGLAGARVTAVPILDGALFFAADLLRALHGRVDVEAVASARIASYGDGTSPAGPPRVVAFPSRAVLEGRTVLLVDTVVDTGRTAAAAAHAAREAGAARVVLACLADKTARRTESTTPDWRGFEAPDRFLVGYGLDAAGRWRCLPYLAALPR